MARLRLLVSVFVLTLALSGCASEGETRPTPPPVAEQTSASPTTSPTPTAEGAIPVDPAAYAMRLSPELAGGGTGVEFITQDDVVHCGIYTAYSLGFAVQDGFSVIAGCRASPGPTIERPADAPDIPCTGLFVSDLQPGSVFCNSGAVFAGDDPYLFPDVPMLDKGSVLAFEGASCEALDAGGVRCTVGEYGFELSESAYSLF